MINAHLEERSAAKDVNTPGKKKKERKKASKEKERGEKSQQGKKAREKKASKPPEQRLRERELPERMPSSPRGNSPTTSITRRLELI